MSIVDWLQEERPREKLLFRGANALSDAELLAIFIRTGNKQINAVGLAREMLKQFSGLQRLVDADIGELQRITGIGKAKCAQIKAAIELGRRYLEAGMRTTGQIIGNSRQTRDYLLARLQGYTSEVFACLFLDIHYRVIHYEELFNGTIDGAQIYPREVVRKILSHNAAAVIFCHNHPSGCCEPSDADRSLTRKLQQALNTIEVQVLDHVIVGSGQTMSFAEQGLL